MFILHLKKFFRVFTNLDLLYVDNIIIFFTCFHNLELYKLVAKRVPGKSVTSFVMKEEMVVVTSSKAASKPSARSTSSSSSSSSKRRKKNDDDDDVEADTGHKVV